MNKIKNKSKTNKSKVIVGGRFGGLKKANKGILTGKNKWLALVVVTIIAGVGAYYLFFVKADTPGCQAENGTQICGIFEVNNGEDTIISTEPEARYLKDSGWATQWWGLIFQAPTTAYNGAVPIHRVGNVGATWHDWVTDSQKAAKEAKYGALSYEGVVFYAWDHQVPGTIPIYRMTMGGSASKAFFVNNKALVDQWMANDLNWKLGEHMPAIAFYAYPPDYKVAGQANPYDCSVLANYNSDRCKKERDNLNQAVNNPDVDPKTLMPKPKSQPIPEQAAPKPSSPPSSKPPSSKPSSTSTPPSPNVANANNPGGCSAENRASNPGADAFCKEIEIQDKMAKDLEVSCTPEKQKDLKVKELCIAGVQKLAARKNDPCSDEDRKAKEPAFAQSCVALFFQKVATNPDIIAKDVAQDPNGMCTDARKKINKLINDACIKLFMDTYNKQNQDTYNRYTYLDNGEPLFKDGQVLVGECSVYVQTNGEVSEKSGFSSYDLTKTTRVDCINFARRYRESIRTGELTKINFEKQSDQVSMLIFSWIKKDPNVIKSYFASEKYVDAAEYKESMENLKKFDAFNPLKSNNWYKFNSWYRQ